MNCQNIYDYLHSILSDDTTVSDGFINVNTENIPDVYLSVINGNTESKDTWESYPYENDIFDKQNDDPSDDNIFYDDDTDNDTSDDKVAEIAETEPRPVLDVISQERQAVILGNPGSGKTTLLKYLEYRMANNSLPEGSYSDIPIYIPLKELRKDRTLIDVLMDYLQMPLFGNLFQQGRLFFLLDGLNEVQPDVYLSTIAAINWLIEKSHDCGILVTSRLYGYIARFRLPAYCLEGLTKENIRNYILQKTNSHELYERLTEKIRQRDVLKNPLLLSMVVRMWNASHNLSTSRIELYKGFIGYELDKAGIDNPAHRKEILNILSYLAYDMRRFGFISDSREGLESVLACIVDEERVGEMTKLLLRSGLLAVTHSENGFWCISFIHETFQEYFAALYIHEEYRNTGKIVADLSASEWTETFKLLTEHVFLVSSPDRIVQFLSDVSLCYSQTSSTPYFNDRIGDFADILASSLESCTVARNWLAQYILFNMSNFLGLPQDEGHPERFRSLLNAIVVVRDKNISLLLFKSFRWLRFWLYSDEEIDRNIYKSDNINFKTILECVSNFSDKIDLYVALQSILSQYWFFVCIEHRIIPMLFRLSENLNEEENRNLYNATGDLQALLCTADFDLIERETEGKSDLFLLHFRKKLPGFRPEVIRYIYEKLFAKLCKAHQEHLLSFSALPDIIMKVPGLDSLLLSLPQYEVYKTQILKACYVVPDEWLSLDYFNYIEQRRGNSSEHTITLKPLFQDADGKFYMDISELNELHFRDKLCNLLELNSIQPSLERIQYNYFNVLEKGTDIDTVGCRCLDPIYPASNDVYPVITDNSFLLLCKKKKHYKSRYSKMLYSCTIDGITYKLTLQTKATKFMICNDRPLNLSLKTFANERSAKTFFRENYYLFRLKDFTSSQWRYAEKLSNAERVNWGVLGRYVDKIDSPRHFGIVKSTGRNYANIQIRDKDTTVCIPFRFYTLNPGDIVVFFQKFAFRVEDTDIINRYALLTGIVVAKNGQNLFIKADTRNHEKDYFCRDDTNSFSVGDAVRFFPLLNNCRKFADKPMAYGIKRI